jgi:hypothetical protein
VRASGLIRPSQTGQHLHRRPIQDTEVLAEALAGADVAPDHAAHHMVGDVAVIEPLAWVVLTAYPARLLPPGRAGGQVCVHLAAPTNGSGQLQVSAQLPALSEA